ncbi:MAG: HD domain-containing protein [Spirochaetia bacterium]|nr:HD domain-containing protein [Spirochaetia bacterium]
MLQNEIPAYELMSRREAKAEDLRGAYFRDTTAIIHSYPFRRLKHKTQVFFAPSNDHICTRIEHVQHVATIAATICKGLELDDELAWAIGLGHDLGHAPFGHVGEAVVNELTADTGGFRHEMYSLRVVDHLAYYGKGLNLTYAVRDGIISHCGELFEQSILPDFTVKDLSLITDRTVSPATWEGAVVRISDKIAYLGRDFEDAVKLKIISREELPETVSKVLGASNSDIIDSLVTDVVDCSAEHEAICFSDRIYEAVCILKEFNYRHIYQSPLLSDYHTYFERILKIIHDYLNYLFTRYGFSFEAYKEEKNLLSIRFGDYIRKMQQFYEQVDHGYDSLITDYIAGMSDNYALDCINEIITPTYMYEQFNRFLME